MGSGGTEVPFNGGEPQMSDVAGVIARECDSLTATAEAMMLRLAEHSEFATLLIIQQQIVGCRMLRDRLQKIYGQPALYSRRLQLELEIAKFNNSLYELASRDCEADTPVE